MNKSIAVTLGFCGPRVLQAGLDIYYKLQTTHSPHYVTWNHYPLNEEETGKELERISHEKNCIFFDSGFDRGASNAFNHLMNTIGWDAAEFIIGVDPDDVSEQVGFDAAMIKALEENPDLAWVSLLSPPIAHNIREGALPGEMRHTSGPRVFVPSRVDQINISCWRGSFLKAIGGLQQQHAYWGQVESPTWHAAKNLGLKFGYLMDYSSLSLGHLHDPQYATYKHKHVNGFHGSFAEWLKLHG